jgi:ATP-dependent exoDNAse (exonuclease V) beta subunit
MGGAHVTALGITIVGASAGSGKTYRLTQEVTSAVSAHAASRIDVTGLFAVTFTRKAHAELEARIRHKLVEEEAYDEALRLPFAYVGTVHAASLRLLQEFAIDAGLSPNVDVVAGNETKLLRQSFERSLDDEMRAHLDDLAARLELHVRAQRNDWVTPVADIMDLARSNRIAPHDLPAMAEHSVTRLLALLPRPLADGAALEDDLGGRIDDAIRALVAAGDEAKKTAEALTLLRDAKAKMADGELRWSQWVKLSSVSPSKSSTQYVEELRRVAGRYEEHPRLHDDLRELTRAIFDAARAGLAAYQEWKKARRVIDYVDMLDGALDLIEHPRVRSELSQRLGLVVVDEFQDTSPIQLALFMRLQALVPRSTWVGDRKQCIFEYAGADPVLMDAVADWVEREGGHSERLGDNHRSRPALVHACSELFAAALARHGIHREEVVVTAVRKADEGLAELPPFGAWMLDVANATDNAEAIGEGVRRLLDTPRATPVLDRSTKEVRPVRAGDIAILVATNANAARVASALHARGIRVAIARAGLLDTPEGTLVDAALRWLLDPTDRLSAALIDALTGWAGVGPDAWLADQLREVARMSASGAHGADHDDARALRGWRGALMERRSQLEVLSPTETLDATLAALDVVHLCARWPDPVQRIGNLDALRGVAVSYESRCAQEREAATVAGLLRYCDNLHTPQVHRDEMLPSDDQHVPADDGAVVVCTYHKSKGLEWPVVILTSLDRPERRDAFEVMPESYGDGFDPERPLANRRIRYWPWPFGATKKAPLADRAEQSPEGRAVALREDKERARLLYVGFTRARDHLILAARTGKSGVKTAWLDALCDEDGPLVSLPASADDGTVAETSVRTPSGPLRVATRVFRLGAVRPPKHDDERSPLWFERPAEPTPPLPPYRIAPSEGAADWPELAPRIARAHVRTVERLRSAPTLHGRDYEDDVLGNCVHAFLAADVEGLATDVRLERARALIQAWKLASIIRAESLVEAGDALRVWVTRKWPSVLWHREIPIEGAVQTQHGERRVSGIIDLLLETETGWVLIDHKTFPATAESAWRVKCASFIPQLAAYAELLEGVGDKKVEACWVHLPVGGGMVEVTVMRDSQ